MFKITALAISCLLLQPYCVFSQLTAKKVNHQTSIAEWQNQWSDYKEKQDIKTLKVLDKSKLPNKKDGTYVQFSRHQVLLDGKKVLGAHLIQELRPDGSTHLRGFDIHGSKTTDASFIDESKLLLACNYYIGEELGQPRYPYSNSYLNLELTPSELLYVNSAYPNLNGEFRLAQSFIFSYTDFGKIPKKYIIYIDTENYHLLGYESVICTGSVDGTGHSHLYGTVPIPTDSIGPNEYLLQDLSRGKGIFIYNDMRDKTVPPSDNDNVWSYENSIDKVAIDAHYATVGYYDFLQGMFGRNSIDNAGHKLICHLNEDFYVNAYWNGEHATFGAGDCQGHHPLATLDIVGHEFTHGLTRMTSGLIYRGESGAINEALSDIFGKALEYRLNPNHFTWLVGQDAVHSRFEDPFRSMKNPKLYEDPEFYKGKFWENVNSIFFDNGGVHSNSGVLNHMFYLLVDGGGGVNENGVAYDVMPIGWEDALNLMYTLEVGYLTPSSNYYHLNEVLPMAAESAFGVESSQWQSIKEAAKAVGIDNADPNNYTLFLYVKDASTFSRQCVDFYDHITYRLLNVGDIVPTGTRITIEGRSDQKVILDTTTTSPLSFLENLYFDGSVEWSESQINNGHYSNSFEIKLMNPSGHEHQEIASLNLYTDSVAFDFSMFNYNIVHNECKYADSLSFNLLKRGCKSLPVDSEFTYRIFNSTAMLEGQTKAENGSFGSQSFHIPIPLDFIEEDLEEYIMELEITDEDSIHIFTDTVLLRQNNPLQPHEILTYDDDREQYRMSFDLQNNLNADVENGRLSIEFNDSAPNLRSCLDITEVRELLKENQMSFLSLCVDATELLAPTFVFDRHVSFSQWPRASHNEAMYMAYELDDGIVHEIANQEHRSTTTINIPLPDQYFGKILFHYWTDHGDMTIDNIRISAEPLNANKVSEATRIKVHPNPANDELYLSGIGYTQTVTIFNSIGAIVQTISCSENTPISVGHLQPGVYFLQTDKLESSFEKFIKL